MENGIWNLATEEVVKDWAPIEKEEPIITDEKELEDVELTDPITKSDDEKTLNETIYTQEVEEEKKKEVPDEDDFDLPEPSIEEKEEAISDIVDEIKESTKESKELTADTLQKIAEMYWEKEEDLKRQIRENNIKYSQLEKAYENLLDENNNLKYDPNRVKIEDEDLWSFINLRKNFAKNPWDKNIQKDIAKWHMAGLKSLYPEFDPKETSRIINERRNAKLDAIASQSESSAGINQKKEAPIGRPKWFALPV